MSYERIVQIFAPSMVNIFNDNDMEFFIFAYDEPLCITI